MKISDGFDARRLRPREASNWRWRCGAALSALFATLGVLLAMAGAATLLGRPPALGALNATSGAASVLLVSGLVLLWAGVNTWRRCRRRLRRPSDLSLAPHLTKKRS